jgi:hypothetical protein
MHKFFDAVDAKAVRHPKKSKPSRIWLRRQEDAGPMHRLNCNRRLFSMIQYGLTPSTKALAKA